jgi:hypothetical protein
MCKVHLVEVKDVRSENDGDKSVEDSILCKEMGILIVTYG